MRITVNIPDSLAKQTRMIAENENLSISRLTATALEYYLEQKRKIKLGQAVLEMAGKVRVFDDCQERLDKARQDDRT